MNPPPIIRCPVCGLHFRRKVRVTIGVRKQPGWEYIHKDGASCWGERKER